MEWHDHEKRFNTDTYQNKLVEQPLSTGALRTVLHEISLHDIMNIRKE